MKHLAKRILLLFLLISNIPGAAFAAEELLPVGQVVGLELHNDRVTIADFHDTLGTNARSAGLQVGDVLVDVDGIPIRSGADIQEALNHARGIVEITVLRNDKNVTLRMNPVITAEGPRLGLYLRQGVTGIGTVTWYDPDTGAFGALGHGVNDSNGNLVQMRGGAAYPARIQSIRPGKAGAPGQLIGAITGSEPLGILYENAPQGLYGTCSESWTGECLPVCDSEDVRPGPATIRSTVQGEAPREYAVEIVKLYSENREDGRNMLIRVTDSALLELTGGIVQGMSGSPILQDGRIVGAVTHVLVNDPTTGYGIFIENMLDAAA